MIIFTAADLTAQGFVLERGADQRIQFWRRVTADGGDSGVVYDAVSGRTFHVSDDGRAAAVLVACATVGLGAVAASTLPNDVKAAQSQIILDALSHI